MTSEAVASQVLPSREKTRHPALNINVLPSVIVACVLWAIAIYAVAVSPVPPPEILATMGAFP
jgi:hypothetical protein